MLCAITYVTDWVQKLILVHLPGIWGCESQSTGITIIPERKVSTKHWYVHPSHQVTAYKHVISCSKLLFVSCICVFLIFFYVVLYPCDLFHVDFCLRPSPSTYYGSIIPDPSRGPRGYAPEPMVKLCWFQMLEFSANFLIFQKLSEFWAHLLEGFIILHHVTMFSHYWKCYHPETLWCQNAIMNKLKMADQLNLPRIPNSKMNGFFWKLQPPQRCGVRAVATVPPWSNNV